MTLARPFTLPTPGASAPRVVGRTPSDRWPPGLPQAFATGHDLALARWRSADDAQRGALQASLRGRLRSARAGTAETWIEALAAVAAAVEQTLGHRAYRTQVAAAWWMLQGQLVEMATGEGKTLAAALAAGAAALAGRRTHVLTANDYLVQRDRDRMAPAFARLGLACGAVTGPLGRAARRRAYAAPIVYLTGRELAFDHLQDRLRRGHADADPWQDRARAARPDGADAAPVLPDFQRTPMQALIDEADALLLDEALTPFIVASAGAPPDRQRLEAARRLALALPRSAWVAAPTRRDLQLTPAGLSLIDAQRPPTVLARAWRETVREALVAEHLMQAGRDHVVRDGRIALVDAITGRIAEGREWQGELQALIALKEGLAPTPPTHIAARIVYPQLLPRYRHLGGMSGTLSEARLELQRTYGLAVRKLPPRRPNARQWLGTHWFADQTTHARWITGRVRELTAQGRPVLIGTDSVAASQRLASHLAAAGLPHRVLNALHDEDEHAIVAAAGEAGAITVATHMAGRGTDILLSAAARAAGGLHVVLASGNPARRLDRQLMGRAARQGDPGSAERALALDDPLFDAPLARSLLACTQRLPAPLARLGRMATWRLAVHGREAGERRLRRQALLAEDARRHHDRLAGGRE